MNEKIKQISEDYINEMLEIITKEINNQIDARFDGIGKGEVNDPVEVEPPLSEDDVRCIATDVAREVVNDSTIDISA